MAGREGSSQQKAAATWSRQALRTGHPTGHNSFDACLLPAHPTFGSPTMPTCTQRAVGMQAV